MSVLTESVISTTEAAEIAHVSRNAIHVWVKKGVHGLKLEGAYAGAHLKTSREALSRFLTAINVKKLGT